VSVLCSRKNCPHPAAANADVCTACARRREWERKHAAAKREAKLAEQLRASHTCPRRQGPGICGGKIRTEIGQLGQTILVCEACERRKAGICRDCPAPVYGKRGRATRCAKHAEVARVEAVRASVERNHDAVLERARAYYRDNDDVRQRRIEYKRAWRKANPEKVRAQKKRYIERAAAKPNSAYNRYHRKYRAKYRLQKRELERDRLKAAPPPRKTSPKCTKCGKSTRWRPIPHGHAGRPWTVCTKCLFPCERRERARNRRLALQRSKEWFASIPDPARIKRPPRTAVRGPGWERTCISPDCDVVVTHRKKKCTKCRQRDAELARQKLEAHRGRGRRTDREVAA
jgi:hypothetical protein